jgi:uncharacterized membrane protein YheB (UPF0754 family)
MLVSIPVISGFIGWVTNSIAVAMIFRPRKPVNILGLRIIGLIPKRKADLARKIGETVEQELISHQDIQKSLETPGFRDGIIDTIMLKLDDRIGEWTGANPFLAMFAAGKTANIIKDSIRDELQKALPDVMASMFEKMESHVNFKEIVREKIEGFDFEKLERIIYAIAAKELRAIEWYGGVLGFLVGLVQVAIITIGELI